MTSLTGTCKDCPCKEPFEDNHPDCSTHWDFWCCLDPEPLLKKADDWCYRGREIMEYEGKVAAFLAQENCK